MKVIMYVFSGTGNTLKVANLYKKYLDDHTTIYQIQEPNDEVPNPNDYDVIGFGYPIHAFNAPEVFVNFIKKLPNVENKKCFIFKTSGEGLHFNDGSSQKTINLLKKKRFIIMQERHIVMPYNIIYRHKDSMVKQMWIYAKALVDLHCREIKEEKIENVGQPFYKKIVSYIFRIEWWWAKFHGTWFRVDKNKCIDCGKCLSECPMKNITKNKETYKFHHHCAMCMRCSFHCPTDAIHIGIFKYWKVRGDYNIIQVANDTSIQFPYIDGKEKGRYKIYRKYYRECNNRLLDANIDIKDYL